MKTIRIQFDQRGCNVEERQEGGEWERLDQNKYPTIVDAMIAHADDWASLSRVAGLPTQPILDTFRRAYDSTWWTSPPRVKKHENIKADLICPAKATLILIWVAICVGTIMLRIWIAP